MVGAGFTNIHVELPVLWLLIGISIVAALLAWSNLRARGYGRPLVAVGAVFGAVFVFSGVIPGLFQRFYVGPNELEWERPYILNNIALTSRPTISSDRTEAFPCGTEPELQDTRGQQGHD